MAQSLRRSQFIITYGPGAILEGPHGPRVIPTLGRSGVFERNRPASFEITDRRLSEAALNGALILRLPSNAELGLPDSWSLYNTDPFPSWALCINHGILYRKSQFDSPQACPRCPAFRDQYEAWRQVRRQAIRFVRACPAGHLDDVDWPRLMRHRGQCRPTHLRWNGGGGALRLIDIVCPNCGASVNLSYAYNQDWPCSGRFPEHGYTGTGCTEAARIIQRGAANLRISEIQTALTIPPRSTPLHRILETLTVRTVITLLSSPTKQDLLSALRRVHQQQPHILPLSTINEINQYRDDSVAIAIQDTIGSNLPTTPRQLRVQELDALRYAAACGAPPHPSSTPGWPDQFEVVRQEVRLITGPHGHTLRITPVNRLRVVMVQTGYRRLKLDNPVVDCAFLYELQRWYPGVELFGEGIFLDLALSLPEEPAQHFPLVGQSANTWAAAWANPAAYGQQPRGDDRDQLHPVFVWWHTLAHRLINGLAVDSGYSSTAIRERVFISIDERTGEAGGGILLYTVQPGGDGTLGGLVALVPQFERVLSAALRNIDACSNDPLCGEESFGAEKYNGAACYACLLISETSCEHRNMRLDRNLLLENQP